MRHSYRHLTIFVLFLALTVAGRAEELTLPRGQRPEWLSSDGLVMAGSWEALRRGARTWPEKVGQCG